MLFDFLKMFVNCIINPPSRSNQLGEYGEKLTERELNRVNLFGIKGKTLKNLYIPKNNGETSEIDLIYITQKGILVIESKNYSGWIFGNSKDQYWTQSLQNGTKNRFYNPIKQNQAHIKWLQQYLRQDIMLFSLIVFSERCKLKKITFDEPNVYVVNRHELYAVVRDIWTQNPDTLSESIIEQLYKLLEPLNHAEAVVKQQHINAIQRKSQLEELICPKCGAKLVIRIAKNGANAGKQFYGCSRFPRCYYTHNID